VVVNFKIAHSLAEARFGRHGPGARWQAPHRQLYRVSTSCNGVLLPPSGSGYHTSQALTTSPGRPAARTSISGPIPAFASHRGRPLCKSRIQTATGRRRFLARFAF